MLIVKKTRPNPSTVSPSTVQPTLAELLPKAGSQNPFLWAWKLLAVRARRRQMTNAEFRRSLRPLPDTKLLPRLPDR